MEYGNDQRFTNNHFCHAMNICYISKDAQFHDCKLHNPREVDYISTFTPWKPLFTTTFDILHACNDFYFCFKSSRFEA
jgi:hypothetical protein